MKGQWGGVQGCGLPQAIRVVAAERAATTQADARTRHMRRTISGGTVSEARREASRDRDRVRPGRDPKPRDGRACSNALRVGGDPALDCRLLRNHRTTGFADAGLCREDFLDRPVLGSGAIGSRYGKSRELEWAGVSITRTRSRSKVASFS